ncbi:hypothetical protein ANCCAN_08160 [Ancylostoma caninum]|uniref:Carbohydrate sulfotransferase n=1 Tax=Ancylostoma caninum TaxID=29170 RepID=A0A368GNB6_ANCCA|nr:hypothetical protein ANCCAN_08160 [Ancylostoma caninum]
METTAMNARHIHAVLLSVFAVVLMLYSMNSSDGMIGLGGMVEADEEIILHRYHSRNKKAKIERAQLREMDIVEEFNSDPLPNRTDLRSADEMCANSSDFFCIPALRNFETELRVCFGNFLVQNYEVVVQVAPKYKVSTCVVQKSMSTVMTAIFCYLFNEDEFQQAGRELLKETKRTRFCENRNEARSMRSLRWRFGIRNGDGWIHTMVTRDPVDRFLSGFVDKCIRCRLLSWKMPLPGDYCNGCKANMTCFIIKEYERMVSEVKKDRFTRTFEDRHFFPQNWRCELSKHLKQRRFIRYSSNATDTLLLDLFGILAQQKVENSTLDFIRGELTTGRTPHSTVKSYARSFLEERLRSSAFLMEYIVRMFYYDFKILHYDFPIGFK